MRILLVEDDILLGDGICQGLKENNYTPDWIQDGETAFKIVKHEHFDAIILDLGLPKKSGIEILKHIRDNKITTPVIILTARDTIEDRVAGLDAGADDYLTKPFELEELYARIRSCQRRASTDAQIEFNLGNLILKPNSREVLAHNEKVFLSRREYSLLYKLMEKPNSVISRELLTQSLYGWSDDIESNTIEVHIHNLRKKIGSSAKISTIRGIGYIIEEIK
jgi:two-component system, OmpR family, response regulator QseB